MNLKDCESLARELMQKHGVASWRFYYDRSVRRFGCCHYGTRSISLSRKMVELNDVEHVRDVILHEIAHALAGSDAGHGYKWRSACMNIGARPNRCYDSEIVATVPKAFKGTCPGCIRYVLRFLTIIEYERTIIQA